MLRGKPPRQHSVHESILYQPENKWEAAHSTLLDVSEFVFYLAARDLVCYYKFPKPKLTSHSQCDHDGRYFFSNMCSNCLFQTTSSVNFWELTSPVNGGHSSHISGNAKRCYFKYIVIIKQNCCSLHPSIFYPLFRLFNLPPTEEKMGIASAMLLNLNWTITWNSIGAQCMMRYLMQVHKNAPQH